MAAAGFILICRSRREDDRRSFHHLRGVMAVAIQIRHKPKRRDKIILTCTLITRRNRY